MATIEERYTSEGQKAFRVKVRLRGKPVQTATFVRLTDAKKWAASTESAIRENRYFKTAESKRHTFADMVERYPSSSGLLSVTSDKGILCTGKFSYYKGGNKGSGKFSCSDGRQGTYKYVVSGHEGHGVGQTTKGEDVEFYFNKQK